MCETAFRNLGITKYDVLDDGDDIVVIVERGVEAVLQRGVFDEFLSFGHEIKIENIAYHFEDLNWCQCHPVQIAFDRWKLVRDPFKIIARGLSGIKYFTNSDDDTRRKLINSLGHCELVLNLGVPVLQEYALMCIRNSGTEEFLKFDSVDEYYHRMEKEVRALRVGIEDVVPHDITAECRISFQRAFGISVGDQLEIESQLRSLNIQILGGEDAADEIDLRARKRYFGHFPSLYPLRE
jgi:hypothetical protein